LELFQLGILRFPSDKNGNIGIRIFPQRKEILICCAGFGGVALHGVSTGETEMRQGACRTIPDQSTMVQDFLEFGGSGWTLLRAQVSLGADVHGIQTGVSSARTQHPQLIGCCSLKKLNTLPKILAARFYLRAGGGQPDRLHNGILRESLGEVIRKRLRVSRIARQCIGQRRLRPRIAAPWRERYSYSDTAEHRGSAGRRGNREVPASWDAS
jgi:hypothetical protein